MRILAAEPLVRWDWIFSHGSEIWSRFVQHVQLTVIAVGLGLAISFPLAVLSYRHRVLYAPITWVAISQRSARYLRKAGIAVPRAGSHTLRHTCVQRLVDTGFDLKTIGDYVGHGSPSSTTVYTKVDVEALRVVALGDGEAVV